MAGREGPYRRDYNTTSYVHPLDENLNNLHKALRYNADGEPELRTNIGEGITISGNVNIPGTITVESTPENPVHTHITEVGTSGILDVPYMPIGGTVTVSSITNTANVNILNSPAVTVTSGNIIIQDGGGSITVDFDRPVPVTDNGGSLTIDGNVGITGTANVAFPAGATNLFGELYASTLTPTIQLDALHGYDPNEVQTYTASGGNVDYSYNTFQLTASSTTGSYALVRSRDFNSFRSGESMIGRWLVKFGAAKATTSQRIGLNNQEQSIWLGYNGTDFGIALASGDRAEIRKVTIASYSGAQTVTLTLNGSAYTISILAGETINAVAQRIALAVDGSTWLARQVDNTVVLLSATTAAMNGTFSITSSGTLSATITQLQAGAAGTTTWCHDASSVPNMSYIAPGWLTPTYYNSFAIKYVWPRYVFYAFNTATVQYEYIGRITCTDTLPHRNPTFKIAGLAYNLGGGTITMDLPAMYAAVEGIEALVTNTAATSVTHSTLSQNVIHHLLSIQNPYVHNNQINTLQCHVLDMTVSLQCNDPSQILVYMDNALATGIHDFVSQDGKPISYCVNSAATFAATDNPITSFVVGNTGSTTQFDLSNYRINLPPGSKLSIAVISTGAINKASVGLTWHNV